VSEVPQHADTPAEQAEELVEVEVWRPGRFERGRAPARHRPERDRAARPQRPESRPREPAEGGARPEPRRAAAPAAPRSGKPHRPERRERAPDPDSPFAALAKLKAELEARNKGR
jgi:ATP-dependent RNA helicase SUPV3L1/SUV3